MARHIGHAPSASARMSARKAAVAFASAAEDRASPAPRRSRRRAADRRNGGSRSRPAPPWRSAVRRAVLGMGHGDVAAEQVHRLLDEPAALLPARASKRLAGSSTMRRRGEAISSISGARPAAESTTLASSGSMPRSTPWRSAIASAFSISARRSRQASGPALSGWRAPLVVRVAGAGAQRDQPVPMAAHDVGEHRQAGAGPSCAPRGSGWIML